MPGRSRSSAVGAIPIAVLLFLLTLPGVTTRFYASDEVEYFAWLRSLAFDRDVNFQNEYQYFYDLGGPLRHSGFHETFLEGLNEAGRRKNYAPIGTALLWVPFFAAGHVVASVTGTPANGFTRPYIAAVTYGSACYGFAALLLAFAISRRLLGDGLPTTIAVWAGTPLVFYMYVAPGFSHACSAFAVSLFLWTWLHVRKRWTPGGAVLLGAAGALMAMVREQDVFFVAGPALDYARWALRGFRTSPDAAGRVTSVALAGIVGYGVSYTPQLLAYLALNGHPGPTQDVARKMTWTSPHFFEVLLSTQHGFFFWTPLALVGVLGLILLASQSRADADPDAQWIGALALLMCGLQVYISGCVESWTVAGSFGQRRFVALTPLIALGLTAWSLVIHSNRRTIVRGLWATLMVLCLWWNVGLMSQFGLHTMDRQRLTLGRNARVTFLELPAEFPSLVWRYFTDRQSLLGLPQR
jgi:hypothetical protein